ncbi:hypothetical protein Vau01_014440 [Virgisporangium aurantiacum]|uniref:Hsp70 protein n=1 Tax=Virgisporangium aurantiacum TaxID=175570 RepID=A0A8J3Z086_9ACTN|nr:hypothetical protein Vau01_014440 [Virgisporangium aurantiacum]
MLLDVPDAALGIDYGTSSTVAVIRSPDGRIRPLLFDSSPLLPSAVFINDAGRILVGRDAERSARLAPERFEPHPKRRIDDLDVLLGERAYSVTDLVAAVLARVRDEVARTLGGTPPSVTMTCPATWGAARRQVLLDAAAAAGLPPPTLVPEPVAAATYFAAVLGHAVHIGQCVVVYDLGAGTCDVSVVQRTPDGFRDLSCQGLDDVGGIDLDALVLSHARTVLKPELWQRLSAPQTVADRRHTTMLWTDARHLREALSRESSGSMFIPAADEEVLLTRQQFEQAAEPVLRRTVDLALSTLRQARVQPGAVAGWFLVGGPTRTPLIATMLHRATGVAPTVLEEPQLVVAEGALHLAGAAAAPPSAPPSPPSAPFAAPVSAPPGVPVSSPPGMPVSPPPGMPVSPGVAAGPFGPAPMYAPPPYATPPSESSWPPTSPVSGPPTGGTTPPVVSVAMAAPASEATGAAVSTPARAVGTGLAELYGVVAAGFASMVLLLIYGNWGAPSSWLVAGLLIGAAAAWRAWRLVGPGPRVADWTAIVLAGIGAVVMLAYAAMEVA